GFGFAANGRIGTFQDRQNQREAAGTAGRQPVSGAGVACKGNDKSVIRLKGDGVTREGVTPRRVRDQAALVIECSNAPPAGIDFLTLNAVLAGRMKANTLA